MLNILLEVLASAGIAGAKSFVAGVLALLITVGSAMPRYMGKQFEMASEPFEKDNLFLEASFELTVEADELSKRLYSINRWLEDEVGYYSKGEKPPKNIFGHYIEYSPNMYDTELVSPNKQWGSKNTVTLKLGEIEFKPFKLYLPKEEIPGIYENGVLDISGKISLTYNRKESCGELFLDIDGASGEYFVCFDSKMAAFSPNLTKVLYEFMPEEQSRVYSEYFNGKGICTEMSSLFELLMQENGEKIQRLINELPVLWQNPFPEISAEVMSEMLSDKELVSLFTDFIKNYASSISSYITKRTVDGEEAYIFEMYGKDYLKFRLNLYENTKDDSVVDSYKNLVKYLNSKEQYRFILGDKADAELKNDDIRSDFSKYFHQRNYVYSALNDGNFSFAWRVLPDISVLRDFYDHSRIKHTVYRKDDTNVQRYEFVVAENEKKNYIFFKIEAISKTNTSEITKPDNAIAMDKTISEELFDNKLAYNAARKKGVSSLEIFWNSKMTAGEDAPKISDVRFEVDYKSGTPGAEKNSSAYLVDGSVYLPLRQLMENAGYEVLWDAENYKAYVSVDGKKTEMTGKLIDSKTYVKVRDFEKLGAKVTYTENIYYAVASDDFFKTCEAVIAF